MNEDVINISFKDDIFLHFWSLYYTHSAKKTPSTTLTYRGNHWSYYSASVLLFRVNVTAGPIEERMMLSGIHTVTDIFCVCCGQIVGWKYVSLYPFITHFLCAFS